MKIVAISDLHGRTPKLESGDVLVIAGDSLARGKMQELMNFENWLSIIKHKYGNIIVIPGNHDWVMESDPTLSKEILKSATLLINEEVIINGVKFYGSPTTPMFRNWAFMQYEEDRKCTWDKIPTDVDVLITHGPVKGILDKCADGTRAGCEILRDKIGRLNHGYIYSDIFMKVMVS